MAKHNMWPTPLAHDAVPGHASRLNRYGTKHGGKNLNDRVAMWPTPTLPSGGPTVPPDAQWAAGATAYRTNGSKVTVNLLSAVNRWPTPTARDHRSGKASPATHARNSRPLPEAAGTLLNPFWVNRLMGFPDGWTDGRTASPERA
jgi:hypothetical protein